MSKKIMFISCGKHNGNTFQAAKVASDAAREAGAEVLLTEAVRLSGIGRGCYGCMKCQQSGDFGCAFQDEAADLILQMPDYDMLVFCAPVYFFSFGSHAKGIIDRLFSMVKFDGEDIRSPLKGKVFALIATSGNGEADSGYKPMLQTYRKIAEYFRGTNAGELYFPFCDALRGGLANDVEMPAKAKAFGKMLAGFIH